MPSSIFSSEARRVVGGALTTVVRVVGAALAPCAVAAAIVFAAGKWYQAVPSRDPNFVHDTFTVDAQIRRARTISKAEVVLIGDSSCLMGVDPYQLSRLLDGMLIESLCNIGYVGPEGYAKLLSMMRQNGVVPRVIVLLINEQTVNRAPSWSLWVDFIDRGGIVLRPDRPFFAGARDKLREVFSPFLNYPMPSSFGIYYGSGENLRTWILNHRGSAVEPQQYPKGRVYSQSLYRVSFTVSDLFRESLDKLAPVLRDSGARVVWGFTPFPKSLVEPESMNQRLRAEAILAEGLGLSSQEVLELPLALEDHLFGSGVHLAERGRTIYTKILAKALREVLATP